MPQQSQHSSYGNPYQSHPPPGAQNTFGAYGGFMNDPTAQMGFQVGQTAFKHGTEYMEQNVSWRKVCILDLTEDLVVQQIRECVSLKTLL